MGGYDGTQWVVNALPVVDWLALPLPRRFFFCLFFFFPLLDDRRLSHSAAVGGTPPWLRRACSGASGLADGVRDWRAVLRLCAAEQNDYIRARSSVSIPLPGLHCFQRRQVVSKPGTYHCLVYTASKEDKSSPYHCLVYTASKEDRPSSYIRHGLHCFQDRVLLLLRLLLFYGGTKANTTTTTTVAAATTTLLLLLLLFYGGTKANTTTTTTVPLPPLHYHYTTATTTPIL